MRSAFRAHGRTAFRAVCQGLCYVMAAMTMVTGAHLRYLISLVAVGADAGIVVEDEETTGAFVSHSLPPWLVSLFPPESLFSLLFDLAPMPRIGTGPVLSLF